MRRSSMIEGNGVHPGSSAWSEWGQYWMSNSWNRITHLLQVRVRRRQNEVTVECATQGIELRMHELPWQGVEGKSVTKQWLVNGITHQLRGQIGRNEVGINLAADGMAYAHLLKVQIGRNKVRINVAADWMGYTHFLRVPMGWNEVSMERTAPSIILLTRWEFKLVETKSVSN